MAVALAWTGSVALVTLDWPQRRNAMGPAEAAEVLVALRALAADPQLQAVVITGNGAFCAGGDLVAVRRLASQGAEAVRETIYSVYQQLIRTIIDLPVPTAAALDGPAIGLGMDIALACDRRYMSAGSWLAQGWSSVGLIPATGGVLLLQHRASSLVWPMAIGSKRLGPAECEVAGLATEVNAGSAAEAAISSTMALLNSVQAITLAAYVELERHALRAQLDRHLELCLELQVGLITSPQFLDRTERFARKSDVEPSEPAS